MQSVCVWFLQPGLSQAVAEEVCSLRSWAKGTRISSNASHSSFWDSWFFSHLSCQHRNPTERVWKWGWQCCGRRELKSTQPWRPCHQTQTQCEPVWAKGHSYSLSLLSCWACPGHPQPPMRLRGSLPLFSQLLSCLSNFHHLLYQACDTSLWQLSVLGCCSGHLTWESSLNDLLFFCFLLKV